MLVVLLAATASSVLGESLPQDIADRFGAKCSSGAPPQFALSLNASSNKLYVSTS